MRILYVSERPPYPFFLGGAARCAHQLLHVMASELGVECAAVGSKDYSLTPWSFPQPEEYAVLGVMDVSLNQDRQTASSLANALSPSPSPAGGVGERGMINCGYPVHVIPDFVNSLGGFMDSFKPDLVWAQLEGARELLELTCSKGVQGLFYLHDAEFDPAELRTIAALKCHIVCSSGFLAKKAEAVIGRQAHVIYPASEWYFGTAPDPQGYITMINPHRVKGVDTLLAIAQRLPKEKFLLVESWKLDDAALTQLQDRLTRLPNVHFSHRVSDMKTIYAQTKLLLVPSVWEEGFGMVVVEAQSCGIPVIASARGGLPESVGEGGMLIQDYRNVDRWIDAIGQVLANPVTYTEWAQRALRHARADDFVPAQLAHRFLAICFTEVVQSTAAAQRWMTIRLRLRQFPLLGRLFHHDKR